MFQTADGALAGRIPTACLPDRRSRHPERQAARLDRRQGARHRPEPNGPNPFETTDANTNSFQYLPLITLGKAGILDFPSDTKIASLTRTADTQVQPVHDRYDQLSIIRSIELILGLRLLGLFDALATPMYDAFASTPENVKPFDALPESVDILARSSDTAANRTLSVGLDFDHGVDRVPQRRLDAVLWKSVYGPSATPPPGPNASGDGGVGEPEEER